MPVLRLVFSDIDGTLTGHGTKPVDAVIRQCIRRLQAKDIRFGIATSHGFNEKLTRKFFRYYGFDFMVLENGSLIYLKKEKYSCRRLTAYDTRNKEKIRQMRSLKTYFLRTARGIKTTDPVLTINGFYDIFHMQSTFLRVHFGEMSFAIRPLSINDSILPVIEVLRKECRKNGWKLKFIEAGRLFVQIGIANKAEGVKYLAGYLDVPLQDVCAIGDAENDIEMLNIVGLPACPADVDGKMKKLVRKHGGIVASRDHYFGTRQILTRLAACQQGVPGSPILSI